MTRRQAPEPEVTEEATPSAAESPEDVEVIAAQVDEPPEVVGPQDQPEDLEEEEFAEGLAEDLADDESGSPDYLDDLRRLQAEFENYKKQVARRQSEQLDRAAESIVTSLLPVLDAGDRARAHGAEEAAGIAGLLQDTLRKEGLESLGSNPGDPFDPNVHDAVAHEPADEGESSDSEEDRGAVLVEVLREGYTWKGRLLRPAMVRVKG